MSPLRASLYSHLPWSVRASHSKSVCQRPRFSSTRQYFFPRLISCVRQFRSLCACSGSGRLKEVDATALRSAARPASIHIYIVGQASKLLLARVKYIYILLFKAPLNDAEELRVTTEQSGALCVPSNASSSLSLLFYSATPLASTLYCARKCRSRALDLYIHCCPGLTQRALIHIYIAARRVSIHIYDVMWTMRSGKSHQTLIWPWNTNLVPKLISFLIQKSKLPQPNHHPHFVFASMRSDCRLADTKLCTAFSRLKTCTEGTKRNSGPCTKRLSESRVSALEIKELSARATRGGKLPPKAAALGEPCP